ncbi:APC family permease [Halodesulfovibrio sp.]|uniref:APC family permease n=1 Tax=Halodesulfovibrio sp. TaxID=1912772 RepID=UPI0025C17DD2|nr:APC family permease [Halodesulfovibrio sp.]
MAETQTTLKKTIKPSQAWALALGAILGWGAFVLPALRFLPTAGPLAACIGFALGGCMLLFVAMSYGDMIGKYPVAGGEFVFAYVGFGPTAAFICGWALALGYICIIALNASALALLFRFLLPGVFEVGYLYTIVGWKVYAGELAMLIAILVGCGWINYRGADLVGKIQVFLAIALVGGVFALFAGTTMYETSSLSNLFPLYAEHRSPLASIMAIVAIAPWLYVGFDTIPQAAEEFDFPHEMATKLMITAIMCGVVLYAMVTLAVAGLMPYKELLAMDVPWATGHVAHLSLGRAGSVILAIAVSAAIFTGINGFFIASSRLLFSIGRARILPSWFGDIHPKYGTPHKSIVFVTLLTIIAPFFGREVLNWVVDMSAVGTVIGYLFTCMAAYKVAVAFRSEEKTSKKIIFAAIGSVSSVICILLLTVPGSPGSIGTESWIALVLWTLLGAFFYKLKMGEFKGLDLKTQRSLMMGGIDLPVFFKK